MRAYTPVLNGKGLLAAAIAILSGPAAAEVAGRVSFVSGDVSVTGADGASRALARGAAINGGDRISTRAGRVQIRFTDGGFVSLQPNTVFGVDEYLYANRKPEETSLFFSLIQGGMRTITGAIGKVNKKSYQVRTPVATIGIRGTEYLATVDGTGLIVSVGKGFVNVANGNGDITGGAGQNIVVRGLQAPPLLGREEAGIKATGVDGDGDGDDRQADDRRDRRDPVVRVADVLNERGDYLYLFTTPAALPNTNPNTGKPDYVIESPFLSSLYRDPTVSFYGLFDQSGAHTGTPGALLGLYTPGSSAPNVYLATESMKVVNSGTIRALSWGEFTDGTTSTNQLLSSCGGDCPPPSPINLAPGEFIPYIVGVPAAGNLGKGTAVYALQGGTPPRDQNGTAGRLNTFVMKVNLDFATVSALLKVTMPGDPAALPPADPVTYTVKTNGDIALLNLGTALRFTLDSSMLNVSDSTGACASSAGMCSASIDAFFAGPAGSQIGASYQIDDSSVFRTVRGVAALGLAIYENSTKLPDGPGYTLAYVLPGTQDVAGGATGYDPATGISYEGLTVNFRADDHLGDASGPNGAGGTLVVANRLAAPATDLGKAGALKWGRWYNDNASGTNVVVNGSVVTLNGNDSLHYMVGVMTQPGIFTAIPQAFGFGSQATYTFQGGTTATGSDGATGHITSGSTMTVTFGGAPTLAYDIGINMNAGNDYHLSSTFLPVTVASNGATFYANSGNSSCGVVGGSGSCLADIKGFFAGQQAQQIGMSYSISDLSGGRQVNGTGAFGRGAIKPNTSPAL